MRKNIMGTFSKLMALVVCFAVFSSVASAQFNVVTVKVYVNDVQVSAEYPTGLDVTGFCNSQGGDAYMLGYTLVVEACDSDVPPGSGNPNDTLFFTILDPGEFATVPGADVTLDRWELEGIPDGNSLGYSYDAWTDASIEVFLIQSTTSSLRDPVSERWSPDAAARSGSGTLWGPAHLAAKSQVTAADSEAYPALLYSRESFEKQVDLVVPGVGLDFVFSRVNRSSTEFTGGAYFGGGWTHNFDIEVDSPNLLAGSDPAVVRFGNGTEVIFDQKYPIPGSPSYRYFFAKGWDAELKLTAVGFTLHYEVKFGDGVKWTFENFTSTSPNTTRITSISDRYGNEIVLEYDTSSPYQLEKITDTVGREFTLDYDVNDRISTLTETSGGLGREITYDCSSGKLAEVTYPATAEYPSGASIQYSYDVEGRLETVTDANDTVALENSYDGVSGKLESQKFGEGAEQGEVLYVDATVGQLLAGEDHGVIVTDAAGHVSEHYFNGLNQRVRKVEKDGGDYTTTVVWNANDFPLKVTAPDNMVTDYVYAGPGASNLTYKFRMNLMSITTHPAGDTVNKVVESFKHDFTDFWDARFGESFATEHKVVGGNKSQRTSSAYSTDGKGSLIGMNFDPTAIAPYGGSHHHVYVYNTAGQITGHTYPIDDGATHRRVDTYVYDDDADEYLDRVIVDDGGLGLVTLYEHDVAGRVTKVTDPKVKETLYAYDDMDRLESMTPPSPDGVLPEPVTEYNYDANGNLTLSRQFSYDETGTNVSIGGISTNNYLETGHVYDTRNRVINTSVETGAGVNETEYVYDGNGNVLSVLSPLAVSAVEADNIVEYEYNARDMLVKVVQSKEVITSLEYDAAGRLEVEVRGYGTPEAQVTQYGYDVLGRLTSTINPVGLLTENTLDGLGRVVKVEAKEGSSVLRRTSYTYDVLGRVIQSDVLQESGGADNIKTEYAYSDAGLLLEESVEGDTPTLHTYDTAWRPMMVQSPTDEFLSYEYDQNGNITKKTETSDDTTPSGLGGGGTYVYVTGFAYDALNRRISLSHESGDTSVVNTTEYAYDSFDRVTLVTDPRSNETLYEYDPLGRLLSTTHDVGGIEAVESYVYDANGRLIEQTDPNANDTAHEYDQLNRLVASTLPDGSVERFEYDALGRVLGHTAPGGLRTNTQYDAAGRPVAVSYANMSGRKNPGATSYVYDAVGNLIEASNGVSTVSHTYDALGNAVSETVDYKDVVLEPLTRGYDGKGLLEEVRPPGSGNDISYVRDASGRISQISQNAAVVSAQYYIGARPVLRENFLNTVSVCNTVSGPDPTGRKVGLSIAVNEDLTTVHDWRTYAWDGAYNLDEYEVTTGPLTASAVDYDYDDLNRLDPASISAGWTLDDAGNRDYTMDGDDALMHRYTDVGVGGTRYYDGLGALKSVALGTWYDYDALGRLVKYTEIAAASMTADGTPSLPSASWDVIDGTWEWDNNGTGGDPSDDFLKETTTDSAALLRIGLDPMYSVALEYRNNRVADNSDNDGTTGEYATDDNWSKYYTEVLLAVDVTNDPDFAYLALRIEPDRIGLIEYNGTTVRELDTASVIGAQSVWYGVRASFGADGAVSVVRTSATAGDAIVTLSGISTVLDGLGGTTETIGFTMGAEGRYQFRVVELADTADSITAHVEWDYDAYGRKLAQTTYDGSGAVTAQTRYVYDGARLVQELDTFSDFNSNSNYTDDVLADYVHGPGYVDDVIRSRRDIGGNGSFADTENFYHLQDQQHSTVGLIDGTGAAVEYYTYDAFGVPSIFEDDGTTPRSVSIAENDILYTGRTWLPELNLYDYRQRMYDPSIGRFLSTDPAFDPANMGNPYTYVGNNPGAFVDPYGLRRFGSVPGWKGYAGDVGLTAYSYFISGPTNAVVGTYQAVTHPQDTVDGIATLAYGLGTNFSDTGGNLLSSFDAAINDTDTAGSVVFDIATAVVPVGKAATASVLAKSGNYSNKVIKYINESNTIQRLLTEETGAALNVPAEIAGRLLPGPTQGKANAIRGNEFQNAVSESLGVPRNTQKVTGRTGIGTMMDVEPDLMGTMTGVTEVKDRLSVSFTRQLQAQADYARQIGQPYNLVISPRTQSVSVPLQNRIADSGGIIVQFDPVRGKYSSVSLIKNRVLR